MEILTQMHLNLYTDPIKKSAQEQIANNCVKAWGFIYVPVVF